MHAQNSEVALRSNADAIHLHVEELDCLFNSLDHSPLSRRALDPDAVRYLIDSVEDRPAGAPLALVIHVDEGDCSHETDELIAQAVRSHFERCAQSKWRELRKLFRTGRRTLIVGMMFFALILAISEFVAVILAREGSVRVVQETLMIGGWVALWRPMEIFLYDWWPIRAEAKRNQRMTQMAVQLVRPEGTGAGPTSA
ncbi:MAG: hypothetical protein JNK52_03710 [Zoogloeaceae bacterium]|nr:hypothetical protein [Zoogloeaceae bacterium]